LGDIDYSDSDSELFGTKNSKLFTSKDLAGDGVYLMDQLFLNAMQSKDKKIEYFAALCLATLLAEINGSGSSSVTVVADWVSANLASDSSWEWALSVLACLVRGSESIRSQVRNSKISGENLIAFLSGKLIKVSRSNTAQQVYELCFVLWTLTLSCSVSAHDNVM
jgi:hypothetical protein